MSMTATAPFADFDPATKPSKSYEVREYEQISIPASDILREGSLDVFASVVQRGYFTVRPRRGPLILQAGGFIGIIPLNRRVTIDVRTRVPVSNLSRVLRISGEVPVPLEGTFRQYEKEPDLYPSLVDLYARALTSYVAEIALRGLIREYVRHEEITSFPRGRVLMGLTSKSVAPRRISHKLGTTYFQRTLDNPPNRCLKYAIWLLSQLRASLIDDNAIKESRGVIAGMNRALRTFDGVRLDSTRAFLSDPHVIGRRPLSSLRAYYRAPLDLALAAIHQHAVTLDGVREQVAMPSLVLNMGAAFESYLRNLLRVWGRDGSGEPTVLNGNHGGTFGGRKRLFETGISTQATPDIVMAIGSGAGRTYPVLIDVKYKPAEKLDRGDLNQVIAYGQSYHCNDVVLAQPRGTGNNPPAGLRKLGTIGALTVRQYAFDLGAADIEGEEKAFVAAISELSSCV